MICCVIAPSNGSWRHDILFCVVWNYLRCSPLRGLLINSFRSSFAARVLWWVQRFHDRSHIRGNLMKFLSSQKRILRSHCRAPIVHWWCRRRRILIPPMKVVYIYEQNGKIQNNKHCRLRCTDPNPQPSPKSIFFLKFQLPQNPKYCWIWQ